MNLDLYIEGLLFYKAAPQKKRTIARLLDVEEEALTSGIAALRERLQGGATRLVETETELQLVTAPELSSFIDELRREEVRGDIGKAGAETLAIILYRGPVSRAEIDSIRGVNSSYILRNLMVRGLVERSKQGSGFTFAATPQLFAHLGIERKHELPEYAAVMDQLEAFEAAQREATAASAT